jgi:secondary thiamine-phosphate synthase enzyme
VFSVSIWLLKAEKPLHHRNTAVEFFDFASREQAAILSATMYTLKVRSNQREELVEFTDQVQKELTESKARNGVVVLYVQHTTAGLTVNENADPDVPRDMLHALRTLIPQHGMGFRHGEENSDAHIKASLTGPSVTIPFENGKLLLGRWQGIFLCEFDGGRQRQVIMTILESS